jgi:phosphoglycolate phosphatase-like HAD superfamily hydrolase
MIRAAVFDFDGVVLESVEIKTVAFRRLFADDPQGERMVEYHLANGGVSRFEKFRWFYEEVRGESLTEEVSLQLGDRFSALVLDEVRRCAFVPGARELLARLAATIPLFVASGTPEDELRGIVEHRDLGGWFAGVFGSPPTKAEILRRIMAEHALAASELVFVGDAMTDLRGAAGAGVPFVGRVPAGEPTPFPEGTRWVRDLAELDAVWAQLEAAPPPVPAAR